MKKLFVLIFATLVSFNAYSAQPFSVNQLSIGGMVLSNNGNNQIAFPAQGSIQLNGTGSVQFGGNFNGAYLASDGAANDIAQSCSASSPDCDFVLYPASGAGAYLVVNRVGGANEEQFVFGAPNPATNTNYLFSQVISGTGQYRPVQFNGGSTDAFTLATTGNLQLDNHLTTSPNLLPPNLSANCGSGASASSSNDVRGTVAIGSGTVTSCTLTFNKPYTTTPSCTVSFLSSGTTIIPIQLSALSTTGFTVYSVSQSIGSGYFTYSCIQ